MEKPLLNSEIGELLGGVVRVIRYNDIFEFGSLAELLGSAGAVVILYPGEDESSGHWTCLFLARLLDGRPCLEFFDPYGISPDLEFMESTHNQTNPRVLALWLSRQRLPVVYNEQPIQSRRGNIATCGRHVVVRLWHRDMPLEMYRAIFGGRGADKIVTRLTGY